MITAKISHNIFFTVESQKCLLVKHSEPPSNQVTIGQAMMTCAKYSGRLAPLKNCASITQLMQEIYAQFKLDGQTYFIGVSAYGTAAGMSKRNYEEVQVLDS